jgi:hypothetical protein
VHPCQRLSSWVLVVLGGILLVSGVILLIDAIMHRQWGLAVVSLVMLAVVAFGTARGARQLRGRR